MAYNPSLNDLDEDAGYMPSAGDIDEAPSSVSGLLSQIQSQNPMQQPSAASFIMPEEAKQDIASLMQVASVPMMFANPEIAPVLGVANRFAAPFLNALGRIGYGTGVNTMFEAPGIVDQGGMGQKALSNLKGNALAEALMTGLKIPAAFSELSNPVNYTNRKVQEIRNEYQAAKAAQQEAYRPVTEKYGDSMVTLSPRNYLGFDQSDLRRFTPNVKKSYQDFLDEPNFQNLHDLQSQMGKDWSVVAGNPNKINTAQSLYNSREAVKDKIQSFLGQDDNALSQYNLGSDITKNQVAPYESNMTLRRIARGKITDISPAKLSNALIKGTQKDVGAIPIDHPLQNHLADLNNVISRGKVAQIAIPGAIGGAIGEYAHPGLGGILGSSGAIALSKMVSPALTAMVQEPWAQKIASRAIPLYYGGARGGINYLNQNQ